MVPSVLEVVPVFELVHGICDSVHEGLRDPQEGLHFRHHWEFSTSCPLFHNAQKMRASLVFKEVKAKRGSERGCSAPLEILKVFRGDLRTFCS